MGVQHHRHVLKQLTKSNKKNQRKLLRQGGKPLQHCLRECSVNILSGTVPLSKHQFKKLKRHRNSVRELSRKKTSLKKRFQIEQRGGFLASLLIPILGSIAGAAIKKAVRRK